MSFGFPAYHRETRSLKESEDFLKRIDHAFSQLDWQIIDEGGSFVTGRTTTSFWSWGEDIRIDWADDGITVESKCRLFTQCVDWGKNNRNVRAFFKHFDEERAVVKLDATSVDGSAVAVK